MGEQRIPPHALLAIVLLLVLSCESTSPPPPDVLDARIDEPGVTEPSSVPPPLVIDMDEPLLLDEPTTEERALAVAGGADNAQCFVCHANYVAEKLASRHAAVGMGCATCHGESLAHKNDENNTTPPERMFPAEEIDLFCRACHSSHDVLPHKVLTRGLSRGITAADPDGITCTVCHGDHRMKLRTVVWDKRTGELLKTNAED